MKNQLPALFALILAVSTGFATAQSPAPGSSIDINNPAPQPAIPGEGLSLDPGATPTQPAPTAAPTAAQPAAPAQPAPAATSSNSQLPESAQNLPPEQKEKLTALLTEASTFVQGIRIQEALDRIFEAKRMVPDFYVIYNLEGAAWTKVREFDKARAAFQTCLQLNPDSLEARFNLAELDFVASDFENARANFEAILKDQPRFQGRTRNLILYKMFLCSLMLDDTAKADELLASFSYMSDTPEHYYANAAKSFHAGDKEDARSWLRSASRIYSRTLQDLFVDSLVELKFIDTL